MTASALQFDLVPGPGLHVVVLHGLGDSRQGWKPVVGELGLRGLGWVFVEAPEPYYDGFSWFDVQQLPDGGLEPDLDGVARSRGLLAALLARLERERGLAADRLVLMGFSQGCLMVLDAALRAAAPFAGVVGISGWLAGEDDYPEAFGAAARRQRILWTHGSGDPLIPLAPVQEQQRRLAALGIAADCRVYAKGHGLDPQRELGDLRAFLAGLGVPPGAAAASR